MEIKSNVDLKTVDRIEQGAEVYECITENSLAKILLNSQGKTYSDTGNSVTQVLYDMIYPVGDRLYFQSSAPDVWSGVTASWEEFVVDKQRFISIGGNTWGDVVEATSETEETVLEERQMPIHNHDINDPGHVHSLTVGSGGSVAVAGGTGLQAGAPGQVTIPTTKSTIGIPSTLNSGSSAGHKHDITNLRPDGVNIRAWKRVS